MSSFSISDVGVISAWEDPSLPQKRFVLFNFKGYWSVESVTELIHSYDFNHATKAELLFFKRLLRMTCGGRLVAAYASAQDVVGQEYVQLVPALPVGISQNFHLVKTPFYQGVSGWSFLTSH